MTVPSYGITFYRDNTDPRPVVGSDMSVIGLVLPSADADADVFPLNLAVEFNSTDTAYLAAAGTGDLYRALETINNQLADLQAAARVVAVRVAQGLTIDETIANIIGESSARTGYHALLQAGERLAVIPRLLGSPGYTGRFVRASGGSTAVASAAKAGGNTGNGTLSLAGPAFGAAVLLGTYRVRCKGGGLAVTSAPKDGGNTGNGTLGSLTVDAGAKKGGWQVVCIQAAANGGIFSVLDPDGITIGGATVGVAFNPTLGPNFTIVDGSTDFIVGDAFLVTVAEAVPANGGLFSVTAPNGLVLADASVGAAYTGTHVRFTLNDGSTDYAIGDGFDLTVTGVAGTAQANALCAALPAICNALLAHAIVGGPGTTKQNAIDWRETINSQRLIAVDNWHLVSDGVTTIEQDGAAAALGIAVRVDYQNRGIPSHSFANQPVQGIVGLKRYDSFSLVDGATDGQILLSHNIGVTQRGELGVETAAANSGFILICYHNAGDDTLWQMLNVTRMRDYEHLGLLKAIRLRLGRENINGHGIQAVLNDVTAFLQDLVADEHVLPGLRVGFERDKNSPENLRLGRFRLYYAAEEAPALIRVDVDSRRNRESLNLLLDELITQADTLVAL